jgi:hypothetical protein
MYATQCDVFSRIFTVRLASYRVENTPSVASSLLSDVTAVAETRLLCHCLATCLGFQQICLNIYVQVYKIRCRGPSPHAIWSRKESDVTAKLRQTFISNEDILSVCMKSPNVLWTRMDWCQFDVTYIFKVSCALISILRFKSRVSDFDWPIESPVRPLCTQPSGTENSVTLINIKATHTQWENDSFINVMKVVLSALIAKAISFCDVRNEKGN